MVPFEDFFGGGLEIFLRQEGGIPIFLDGIERLSAGICNIID